MLCTLPDSTIVPVHFISSKESTVLFHGKMISIILTLTELQTTVSNTYHLTLKSQAQVISQHAATLMVLILQEHGIQELVLPV